MLIPKDGPMILISTKASLFPVTFWPGGPMFLMEASHSQVPVFTLLGKRVGLP